MEIPSSEKQSKVCYIANQYATVTKVLTNEKPSALRSIIAGSTAGAVEIGIVIPRLPNVNPFRHLCSFNSKH